MIGGWASGLGIFRETLFSIFWDSRGKEGHSESSTWQKAPPFPLLYLFQLPFIPAQEARNSRLAPPFSLRGLEKGRGVIRMFEAEWAGISVCSNGASTTDG